MLLLHPRLHTLHPTLSSPDNPWGTVEAVQVDDSSGRVVFAGSAREALARRRTGEEVERLEGGCVLPGLIDSHAHTTGISQRPGALDLPDDASPRRWAEAVSQAAATLPQGAWITGRAWNQAVWSDAELQGVTTSAEGFPDHSLLSAAAPGHPVMLHRTDQHAVWANEAAMRAAGITATTPDPEGGRIVRDPQGAATGVFVDEAAGLLQRAMPPLTPAENRMLLRANARRYLSHGVTCVHCMLLRVHELDDYREALGDGPGQVPLRVRAFVYDEPEALAQWAREHTPYEDPAGWFTVAGLKLFADGALGSQGAWFHEPYALGGQCGLSVATPAQMAEVAAAALAGGWQLATHAIGDRAIDETMAAYERGGWSAAHEALKWRIEHVQHPRPESLDKLAALKLYGAMQPIHATRDMRFVKKLLGPQREALAYPWSALLSRGTPLAFGSDYPIETLDPWAGIHAASTRQDEHDQPEGGWHPQWRVSVLEAVKAYTLEAARFSPDDDGHLGHLAPGARADWIALDRDLAAVEARDTKATRVHRVSVSGRRWTQSATPHP